MQPAKVLGIYTFTKRVALEEMESKPRKQQGYSTVSHFNIVHYDCHLAAVRWACFLRGAPTGLPLCSSVPDRALQGSRQLAGGPGLGGGGAASPEVFILSLTLCAVGCPAFSHIGPRTIPGKMHLAFGPGLVRAVLPNGGCGPSVYHLVVTSGCPSVESVVTHWSLLSSQSRLARGREEWESAALQNANTKCNGLLPVWGPHVPESAFATCLARCVWSRGRGGEAGGWASLVVQWRGSVLPSPGARVQALVGVHGVAKERWRGVPRRWRKISHWLSPIIGNPCPSSLAHRSCLEQE